MLQNTWQRILQAVDRFQAIVENDNGPWLGVLKHVLKALLRSDPGVKVAAEHIPHNNPVMPLQELRLLGLQPPVWRAEQHGIRQRSAMADVVEKGNVLRNPPVQVIERVVADGVAAVFHFSKNIRMLPDIIPDAEEGSFGPVCRQLVKHPRRHFRNRPVVERKKKPFFCNGNFPGEIRKHIPNELGCLGEIHTVFFNVHGYKKVMVFYIDVQGHNLCSTQKAYEGIIR